MDYDQIVRLTPFDDEKYIICLEDENSLQVIISETEIKKYQRFLKGEVIKSS